MLVELLSGPAVAYKTLFPDSCAACGRIIKDRAPEVSGRLCAVCFGSVRPMPEKHCAICQKPLEFDYEIETGQTYTCGQCRVNPPIYEQARAALVYEGAVREMIHEFKYQGAPGLARPLAKLGEDKLAPWLAGYPGAVIIPVPLYRLKLFSRGYNPPYLLALHFARMAGLEVAEGNLLRRIRNTRPQFGLKADERIKNVKGAFKVVNRDDVKGRTVIVFDDVYTTGATMDACCKALKKAKPDKILVSALCRAGAD
ncbi:Competence protein F homolog, phosphoribosyltransferase domain; protein YhgH required for utilization of DNA as sole source of carbon and energy [hydrothermal vent metagenome]|uniref:Competence protein F homolog, phosphoribosyltransferase domain protein YhgH required for utilization of DNA as sole source of carbon and energy n=1 Tax=hydrothermal vent metagenome TaxID=652676 RepID=A0A3B1BUL4_9ZZZZ